VTSGALQGVRAVDDTTTMAGRVATMLLADHGAEVVRLTRTQGPLTPADLVLDRNKVLATTPTGLCSELRRLAASADVYVADHGPGELERRGLDSVTLRHRNQRLIHAWMPPYATRGRWSFLPADDLLLSAVAGPAEHYLATSSQPVASVVPCLAITHGTLAATAVVASLVGRQRSGRGRSIAVSGIHAVALQQRTTMVGALDAEKVFSPGKSLPAAPNYRMYKGSDERWFFLAALSPKFFLQALEVLDRVDLMLLPGLDGDVSNLVLAAVREQINPELERQFATKPCGHWLDVMRKADVPIAPVCSRHEWANGELVEKNQLIVHALHPELGDVALPGIAVQLSRTPGAMRHLPHTGDLLDSRQMWTSPVSSDGLPEPSLSGEALPLDGVSVLDLSTFVAAPLASTVLAAAGASVVKIEAPSGDAYRMYAAAFDAVNHSKRSLVLDLRTKDGKQAFIRLVRQCDVMVDNIRPRSIAELGLDTSVLAEVNRRLVRCTVSAYGRRGASSNEPGFDPVFQALSGMAMTQGGKAGPVAATVPTLDACTSTLAALGIVLALYERGTSGMGQEVSTSLAAAATHAQSIEFTSFAGSPEPPVGGADYPGPTAGHRMYSAADGWVAVAATTSTQVTAFLDAAGVAGDADSDAPWNGALAEHLGAALRSRTVDDIVNALARRSVPACTVLSGADELSDPWLLENGFYHLIRDPKYGRIQAPGPIVEWETLARLPEVSMPGLGEDSRHVLADAGLAAEQIETVMKSR